MVFSSMIFLWLFLPVVLIGYYLVKTKYKNVFLVLASLFFYAWGEPIYVFIMILSIIANWGAGLLIEKYKRHKKVILAGDILMNLMLLGYFKYYTFLVDVINDCFRTDFQVGAIALPIGISFFTFQILSYVIDLYRGEYKAQKNIIHLALYISFFPQLIAGPIVKYKDIMVQLEDRNIQISKIAEGMRRFIYGLAKKVIVANSLAQCVDRVYELGYSEISGMLAWIVAIFYSLQIYYDFSGYSDMAIGLGKMFGFDFQENFRYPYLSLSIREFWQRWHISLGTWFREYVYIPLGGNRKGRIRTYVNLLIVFLLTGLWHGANYTFILWGLWHGLFAIIERVGFGKILQKHKIFSFIYTLIIVVFGWVLFRADSLEQAGILIRHMVLPWQYRAPGVWREVLPVSTLLIAFMGMLGCGFLQKLLNKGKLETTLKYSYVEMTFCVILFGLCLIMLASNSYNPFIYFRF